MKVCLMHPEHDFDLEQPLPPLADELVRDLDLSSLLATMAQGDPFLRDVAAKAILVGSRDPAVIVYRQQVLADAVEQASTVRAMYQLAVEAIEKEKRVWAFWGHSPDVILHRSIEVMGLFVGVFQRLRNLVDAQADRFRSPGFTRLFRMIREELTDTYFRTVQEHLRQLTFPGGVLLRAELGPGNKGARYRLCRPTDPPPTLLRRILRRQPASYTFEIPERDESGARALADLRGRGINAVANALAQSVEHVLNFFRTLRAELGFYVSCLNLYDELSGRGLPVCWPEVADRTQTVLTARTLYEPCLGLRLGDQVVGNDVDAENKRLIVITGANQGGKTTFLRSLGLAQLMMQAGMFVAARHFSANVCEGVFTHFPREEDSALQSGKLDEELHRLSQIVDHIRPGSLLLCNESLASTNEREGTEIARPLVLTLIDAQIKVFYVTHFFLLAQGLYESQRDIALFLRAERRPDGQRSFKLVPGAPLPTSYGADLYHRVFGSSPDAHANVPVPSYSTPRGMP